MVALDVDEHRRVGVVGHEPLHAEALPDARDAPQPEAEVHEVDVEERQFDGAGRQGAAEDVPEEPGRRRATVAGLGLLRVVVAAGAEEPVEGAAMSCNADRFSCR